MRILFDNLIFDSLLSSVNVNANYPVTRLQSDHVTSIYKADSASDIITITLPYASSINCCYIGFYNISSAVLTLYNSSDTLLGSINIDTERGGQTFQTIYNVSYVKLTIAASENIYMGCVGIGQNYKLPYVKNNIILKPIDNSTRKYSDAGQSYVNYIDKVHQIDATYELKEYSDYIDVMQKWELLRHPAWVDTYENTNTLIKPMFCDITMDAEPTQAWRMYTWSHNYREVR